MKKVRVITSAIIRWYWYLDKILQPRKFLCKESALFN